MTKDYYSVLGVNPGASAEEVKAAYRRKAEELQLDAKDEGEEFLKIQQGYHLLTDPTLRASYDRQLSHELHSPGRRDFEVDVHLAPEGRQSTLRCLSVTRSFETFEPSFAELFDRWWSNFTGQTPPKAERVVALTIDVLLSPQELKAGGQIELMVPGQMVCPVCDGESRVGEYRCWRCSGQGRITGEFPIRVNYSEWTDFVRVPLDHLGVRNFFLLVQFRESGESD